MRLRLSYIFAMSSIRPLSLPRCARLRSHPVRTLTRLRASFDWSSIKTESQFKGVLRAAQDKGVITHQLRLLWEDFYDNYKSAILGSGIEGRDERHVTTIQASIADRVFHQFQDPYIFPSHHHRILEPFNYYEFGQEYVESLIDFRNSFVGRLDIWKEISDRLAAGHNVVMLANHQTEADPAIFAHLIKDAFPKMAEDIHFVAGDRVITDPLCKPFSMGRNLFCVYSKRHIDDVPEEKEAKLAMNKKTVLSMARQLNKGGNLLWIAPSGGRDRPDENGIYKPNAFDPASVGLMHALLGKSKKEGHLYVMAMVSWKIMPPPVKIEEAIGERRLTNYAGVGISVSPEIHVDAMIEDVPENDQEAKQLALAHYAQDVCERETSMLEAVIERPAFRLEHPEYVQPWIKQPVMPLG